MYYSVLVSCILCAYPAVSVSTNFPDKTEFARIETSSAVPSVSTNATTVALDVTELTSSKQMDEETSTRKYESMKQMNMIKNDLNPAPTINSQKVSIFRLKDEDGSTCILMTVDALISFLYVTKLNEKEESDTFLPDEAQVSGDCSEGEKSSMLLKWKSFALNFDFVKTPGGERWFVNRIRLSFNTKDSPMQHPNHPDTFIEAASQEGTPLFPTPVGRSFKCHREITVALSDSQYPDLNIMLLLRELTLEPFIFKNDDFGQEYLCAAAGAGSFRSETAPFIFGSLLSFASVCTILVYAVYRYLKVNKVQYDAME